MRQVLREIEDAQHGPGGSRRSKLLVDRLREMARVAGLRYDAALSEHPEPMPPERREQYRQRIRDASEQQAHGGRAAAGLHIGSTEHPETGEREAQNVGPMRHKQRLGLVLCADCATDGMVTAEEWFAFVERAHAEACSHCKRTVTRFPPEPLQDGGERATLGDRVAAGAYLRSFLDEQARRSDGPHGALEALQAFDSLFAGRHPHQDVERLTRERDDARRFHTAEHTDRINAEAEIERLRVRTHEIAEAKDAEYAKAMRDYGRLRQAIDLAKERTANWQPSDTAVPSVTWSEYPGSWWAHSSHNSCMDVSALIVERDEARAALYAALASSPDEGGKR